MFLIVLAIFSGVTYFLIHEKLGVYLIILYTAILWGFVILRSYIRLRQVIQLYRLAKSTDLTLELVIYYSRKYKYKKQT